MTWYYAENQRRIGPLDDDSFRRLVKDGKIVNNTLVWREGMTDWREFGLAALGDPAAGLPEWGGACVQCGRVYSKMDLINFDDQWICANCKPVYFQKLREGLVLPGGMEYGGFWIRAGAKVLDFMILGVVQTSFNMILPLMPEMEESTMFFATAGVLVFAQVVVGLAYSTFMLGKYGATIGKMVCQLKVVTPDGGPVSYGRAAGRFFAEWVSALPLYFGYLMAGWDDETRTLHDRICNTRVIKKKTGVLK